LLLVLSAGGGFGETGVNTDSRLEGTVDEDAVGVVPFVFGN